MIDMEKVGQQLALLRKEKGLTGEGLAERLEVSAQAVSKWENGRCLPESRLLPELARVLGCSIDSILVPKELFVLEAVYTDGAASVDVTQTINSHIYDNELRICINSHFIGVNMESDRLKVLTVKYQTPEGIFYTYSLENEMLHIEISSVGYSNKAAYELLGAYYGNLGEHVSVLQKMKHYEYFNWKQIFVNHETFPSSTASEDIEYLLLIYLNRTGIHSISCAENETMYYEEGRTSLYLKDQSRCILPDIMRLEWGKGMECPWAGSLYAALHYMGESYTYEQLMGMSGACYRVCFVEVWDWSCTDALVAYDYATPLYSAIGYQPVIANRLDKKERKKEKLAIMKDLQNDRPVLAINLRIAPEWGVITGYIEDGNAFLCRTYFDKDILEEWEKEECREPEERRLTFTERGGYLVNDFWPFLITHFGDKAEKPSQRMILRTSLKTLVDSFNAESYGGYYQGKQAYEAWIRGLSKDSDFDLTGDRENALRRMAVNDSMLLHLVDARRSAEAYLRESAALLSGEKQQLLLTIADGFRTIHESLAAFRDKAKSSHDNAGIELTCRYRQEQIKLLKTVLQLEKENAERAAGLLV